ncbi:MAG: DUF1203 domain-containing protein [Candidatus Binataceae bacterium]
MDFRITGLPAEHFAPLFTLSDEELAARGVVRQIVKEGTQAPCRVSLTDAQPGDEVLLVNYEHHPVASPYRMRYAVYVREGEKTYDAINQVPEQLRSRTLAVRAFDSKAMAVAWEVVSGRELESVVDRFFTNPAAAYIHVHYAAPGCYAARIERT